MKRDVSEPEWTAEQMNMKKGDTTFKTCGWCEHTGGGSCRYDCIISGSCSLLRDYNNDIQWNTECLIKKLGKKDIEDIIKSKEYEIKSLKSEIENTNEEIKVLRGIKLKAIDSPALPDSRRSSHFNEGDTVFVAIEDTDKPKGWYQGVVVPGYHHHDGCVSYVLEKFPETKGNPWGCGNAVPTVLLESEFRFFQKNKKVWNEWKKVVESKDYNGEKLSIPNIDEVIA